MQGHELPESLTLLHTVVRASRFIGAKDPSLGKRTIRRLQKEGVIIRRMATDYHSRVQDREKGKNHHFLVSRDGSALLV